MTPQVVFLNGSPKKEKSASNKLIQNMRTVMGLKDDQYQIFYAYTLLNSNQAMEAMWETLCKATLFIPVYPVYVDTLPAAVIAVFEALLPYFQDTGLQDVNMSAVANCGFPESEHALVSLENCALFAEAAQLRWLGGLALGAGPMVLNVPMDPNIGGPLKTAGIALKEAADHLLRGEPIPYEVQAQFARNHFPPWVYRTIGNLSWVQTKRYYKTKPSLKARPYQTD